MSTPQSSPSPAPFTGEQKTPPAGPFSLGTPQPTPTERATVEGRWNDQTIQQRLDTLRTDARNHPEFVASLAKQISDVLASKIVELLIK